MFMRYNSIYLINKYSKTFIHSNFNTHTYITKLIMNKESVLRKKWSISIFLEDNTFKRSSLFKFSILRTTELIINK